MDSRTRHRDSISSGIRWSSIGQGVRAVFQILVSIILARILSPQDFGLMAMAGAITGFIVIFQFMGTSAPIIQRKDLSVDLTNSVFLFNVGIGIVLTAGVMATSPILTEIYASDKVTPILRLLALNLMIYSFNGVPGALLRRRMQFDVMAKIGITVGFSTGILEIILAYMGFGVWTLVIGQLAAGLIDTALTFYAARYRPRLRFNLDELKGIWSISVHMTGTNIVSFFTQNSDALILGRWLGSSLLGFYATAARFSVNMLQYFAPVLGRVMFPAYSSMQTDDELLRTTVVRAAGGITCFTFPMMAGIAAISDPFVMGILGPKWEMIIPMLRWLAVVGALKSLLYPVHPIFLARDRADVLFWLSAINAVVFVAAFFVGSQFSVTMVVYALVVAQIMMSPMFIHYGCKLIGLSPWAMAAAIAPHFMASSVMAVSVFLISHLLRQTGMNDVAVVIVAIAAGGVMYSAYMLVFRPPALRDIFHILPTALKPMAARLLRIDLN